MALAPKFAGQKLATGVSPQAIHTLELYLDYVCPYVCHLPKGLMPMLTDYKFSKKLFTTVYDSVKPLVEQKYKSKVQIIFRQQVQPWHPSSTLVHEAGVAVLQTNPEKFWDFSKALFDKQVDYFDTNIVNETRNATYKRLAKIAAGVGLDEAEIYDKLEISDKPSATGESNGGNKTTNDLKLLIKAARLVGIHVSPTVVFDGIVENSISSSFSAEQWDEWLQKNVA